MAGFASVYVASQLTPAGWVTDVVMAGLVIASVVLIGPEMVEIVKHLAAFYEKAATATGDADLKEAGHHFAIAVTKIGVDVAVAILLHKAGESPSLTLSRPKGQVQLHGWCRNTG